MKPIKITIDGGVIQDITDIPDGTKIIVVDYDIDGIDEDRLIIDEEGQKCTETIWED